MSTPDMNSNEKQARHFYVSVAALLSFASNVALLVAWFLLPAGWDFAWSTLR
jgi:hypothetical protein